jgi:hypothetical protein
MKDDSVLLLHIRDCLAQIGEYCREGKGPFLTRIGRLRTP